MKRHILYGIFSKCNKTTLRGLCRLNRTKNWYKLKKHYLICALIDNICSKIITRFFKLKTNRKEEKEEESWCPISLTPVKDITDPYIHDNVVFSRESLIDYFRHSVNFTNPSTTSDFNLRDIKRLECKDTELLYNNRIMLRNQLIDDLYIFNYLEDELEETLYLVVELYKRRRMHQDPYSAREARIKFHRVWLRLIEMDKNRTICVLRALVCKCINYYEFCYIGQNASKNILNKYISESL